VLAGFGSRSGLVVAGVTSVSPGAMGGVARCGSAAIGSKYKGQRGPTASRYWQNFEGR